MAIKKYRNQATQGQRVIVNEVKQGIIQGTSDEICLILLDGDTEETPFAWDQNAIWAHNPNNDFVVGEYAGRISPRTMSGEIVTKTDQSLIIKLFTPDNVEITATVTNAYKPLGPPSVFFERRADAAY